MTETPDVDRSQWASLMEQMSEDHQGDSVTIEILDPTYGVNEEVDRLPFQYATYDDKDDVAIVVVGGRTPRLPVALRHLVEHPSELDVSREPPAMRLVDREGTTTLVSFFPSTD